MPAPLSEPHAAALRAHIDAHLGTGFSLVTVDAIGGGARDAAFSWVVDTLDGQADLWQVDLRDLDLTNPVESIRAAIGEVPDHPWVLCVQGLEELAREGAADTAIAALAADPAGLAAQLPGLWVLVIGPESGPVLASVGASLMDRTGCAVQAKWAATGIHTAPGLMSEASPIAVALRPGAEFWVRDLAPALRAAAVAAGEGDVHGAMDTLEKVQVSAALEVALSPALELLRAEIELAMDRPKSAANRLASVARALDGMPDQTEEQRLHRAVCEFDLAVALRIQGQDASAALESAAQVWAETDPNNAEMHALLLRERGLSKAAAGDLRGALGDLESASARLLKSRKRIDLDSTVAMVHVAVALDERKVALAGIKSTFRSLKREPKRRQDRVAPLVLLSRGVILLREGDQRGASKALLGCVDGADALGPSADLLKLRALTLLPALLIAEDRGSEALNQFESVFAAIEEHGATELLIEALLEGSSTAIDLGELAVAGAWAREGLALADDRASDRPDLLVAHAHRATGVVYLLLGERSAAGDHLGHASTLYGDLLSKKAPLARSTRKLLQRC